MDIKVIDNFLNEKEFKNIEETILSNSFPWYKNDSKIYKGYDPGPEYSKYDIQLTHSFYSNFSFTSDFYEILYPLIEKISPTSLYRIKANMTFATENSVSYGFHKDVDNEKITTGIFYLNTNNGETIFENNYCISSVRNRFVFFNSSHLHTGSTCTDKKYRCLINFNYVD